jgi:hypothetical protein
MEDVTMETLLTRMERLERDNDRLKRMLSLMLIGIAGLVIMGQAQCNKLTNVIEAEEFIVRGGDGMTRARLTESGLTFTDSNRKNRIYLGVPTAATAEAILPNFPQLVLRDENDSTKAELLAVPASLRLRYSPAYDLSRAGAGILLAIDRGSNESTIVVSDKKGMARAMLGSALSTDPRTTQRREESSLVLLDQDGKAIWHAP